MSDEIKAAERKSMLLAAKAVKVLHAADEPEQAAMASTQAAIRLADFVLADLAAREAEQEERAKDIDEEWLLSIGFDKSISSDRVPFWWVSHAFYSVQVKQGKVYLCNKIGARIRVGTALTTTRGMESRRIVCKRNSCNAACRNTTRRPGNWSGPRRRAGGGSNYVALD